MAVKQPIIEKTKKPKEQVKKTQKKKNKKPGPKAMYSTPASMQKEIDKYFESCKGEPFLDKDGYPMMRKRGILYKTPPKHPSMPDLAVYLGFKSRQSLLDYKLKDEKGNNTNKQNKFTDVIERARTRVEGYAVQNLFSRETVEGAKFYLKNAFKEIYSDNDSININNQANANASTNFNNFSDDELKAILSQAKKSSESGELD